MNPSDNMLSYPQVVPNIFTDLGTKGLLPAGFGHVALVVIFVIFLALYLTISVVLFYHWHTYGMKNRMIILAEILFGSVSAILFSTAFFIVTNI